MYQRCYNGVRLLGDGPCPENVQRLDLGAMPYIMTCMETGIQVDISHFAKMEVELVRDMDEITEKVRSITGHYCNIDSGDQVADLLFGKHKLGLKQARLKLTTSGDRESTENEVLVAIQHEHPAIPLILDYKELSKLLGTYVRPMPKLAQRVAPGEWRMMPNLGHTRVPSGRLNCKEPNLLAMPSRTKRGREIRKGFITKTGWKILSVDESQIEVRVTAHLSKDPNLLKVYENREDIYSDFATYGFKLKDERYQDEAGKWIYPTVDPLEHRYPAKTCVLAAIYDVTAGGLLEQMPVICANCGKDSKSHDCYKFRSLWGENNCQALITAFYLKYGRVIKERMKNHSQARRYAYNWDMWGRILHVAAVRSSLEWVVSAALREVGNFPAQSGAQGTIKLTMAKTHDDWLRDSLDEVVHPLLQIHDELLYEAREDVVEEWGTNVVDSFENCVRLDCDIKANMATADTWGDLKK